MVVAIGYTDFCMLKLTVGKNDEDYTTIQEALDAVPFSERAEIVISEGIYNEKLFSDKDDLTIKGKGNVVITHSDSANEILERGRKRGTFRSYTAFFSGRKLVIENVTIENIAGKGSNVGQAIALYLDVMDARLEHVKLLGHQDTLFLAPLPEKEREVGGFYGPRYLSERKRCTSIICNSLITGDVDFIFGSGDALFDSCEIRSLGEGYVAAPSGKKEWPGFIFRNCFFTSESLPLESVFLMRPWRSEGKACFITSHFADHIKKEGLSPWKGREDEVEQCTFVLSSCTGKVIADGKYEIAKKAAEEIVTSFYALR